MNEKLKNPPIKETVIGIGIPNFFNDDLKNLGLYAKMNETYPKISPNYNAKIDIHGKTMQTTQNLCGYSFYSEDMKETVILDNNRITFSDKNKYESFEVFLGKFKKILNIIKTNQPIKTCSQFALKYVNHIFIEQDELFDSKNNPKIKFLPNFSIIENTTRFAQLAQFSGKYIIQSVSDTQLKAFINTSLQFVGTPPRLQVVFVIDTVRDITKDIEPLSQLDDYMSQLRIFKNMIFFSNIDQTIKEFSK